MKYIAVLKQRWEKLDQSWRVAIAAFLVARIIYAIWSWAILTIQPVAVHYIEADHQPATIFLSLQTSQSYAYLREVKGTALTFRAASTNTVTDLESGSLWDIHTGAAISGYLQGTTLTPTTVPAD